MLWNRLGALAKRTVMRSRPGWWRTSLVLGGVAAAAAAAPAEAQIRASGEVGVETRGFFQDPLLDTQGRHSGSVLLRPELDYTWDRRRQSITFEPFVRVDAVDGERTHVDIRTLAWERAWRDWELRVGIRTVFWGVTESSHLVDIVNQTDLVENLDGEDKLGQPMINLAAVRSWGTVDLFVLPGFRERTFPGIDGRLRVPLPVSEDATYASAAGRRHVDWALRWSHAIGAFDVGASYFRGTDRDPRLAVEDLGAGPVLTQAYDIIGQLGVDAQMTTGPWLFKVEGITRDGREQNRYWAVTAGFERTLYQLFGSDSDLGLIAEYLYDDRGTAALTPFADDVFVGGRLAINDVQSTELLAGAIVDRQRGSTLLRVEGSRRLGSSWTVEIEGVGLFGTEPEELLYGLRRDDHVSLTVTRWF